MLYVYSNVFYSDNRVVLKWRRWSHIGKYIILVNSPILLQLWENSRAYDGLYFLHRCHGYIVIMLM